MSKKREKKSATTKGQQGLTPKDVKSLREAMREGAKRRGEQKVLKAIWH